MKNQKGVSMITLIITIIVIIILAAIAFVASGDTVNSAQFSTFAQEFGDYAVNFETGPMAELQEKLGLKGETATKAQKIYASARGVDVSTLKGVITPAGVSFTKNLAYTADDAKTALANLVNAAGEVVTEEYWGTKVAAAEGLAAPVASSIACYQIKDSQIDGYKDGHEFYGKNLGAETHWVTEKGFVFTLPGYPRQVDGEFRMYISPEVYYIATANFGNVINA
ncbi:MAG: hypothetical protein J6B87_04795, partial [Clostridia bacterium]|nr:hypothetical protein [Clostridia bacterium]